ncbi:MAG: NUDIX domain-containing protein [Patescibacteria group bacterium]|nr:NUDIX domain-containing protein [Patescibacteria group bacterium]MDD5121497.1 NUDIX domain-containing protein [Patescibacteria group bacterium]MDD5222185.1 NUDIX domain-containing protein [Patescibacteria group bacterium]MDD5396341.1 NUDIX domain-containing protein [Patescibacteria group bacterium]
MGKPFSLKEFKQIYSKVPRLTIELVVKTKKGIVLTLRDLPHWYNQWHIPGGTVLYNETIRRAATRISKEEIGVSVKIIKSIGFIEYPSERKERGYGRTIGLALLCKPESEKFKLNKEATKIAIFNKLPNNIISEQRKFLNFHLKQLRNRF